MASTVRPRYTLVLLGLAYVISMLDRQVISLLVEPIKADLRISDTQIGLLQGAAFAIFYALLGLPLARIADRGNRRALIVTGLAVWSAATAACGLARSYGALFAARVMVGAGESTLNPAAYSMLGDLFERRYLGRVIGAFHMAGGIGLGLALVLGAWIYEAFATGDLAALIAGTRFSAWQATFVALGLPGVLLAVLMYLTVREPGRRDSGPEVADAQAPAGALLPHLREHRRFYVPLYAASAVYTGFVYALLAWAPAHFARTYELGVGSIGLRFGLVLAVAGALGCVAGGWLCDRLFERHGGRAPLQALRLIGLATIVPAVLAPWAPTATLSMLGLGIAFFLGAAVQPLGPVAFQLNSPPRLRARLSALLLCLNNLVGFGFGPVLVALLSDQVFGPEQLRHALVVAFAVTLLPAALGFAHVFRVYDAARPRAAVAG